MQLRAVRLIQKAEVLVYDDLGSQVRFPMLHVNKLMKQWPADAAHCSCASTIASTTVTLSIQEAIDEFAASSAVCIYAGKRGQKPSTKQSDIDAMLVDYCLQVRYSLQRSLLLVVTTTAFRGVQIINIRACDCPHTHTCLLVLMEACMSAHSLHSKARLVFHTCLAFSYSIALRGSCMANV